MRKFTSAHAKNHFGKLIDAARAKPVAITKYGRTVVVMVAAEEYERMKVLKHPSRSPDAPTKKKERGK
jgi:prevent-host-death family protein